MVISVECTLEYQGIIYHFRMILSSIVIVKTYGREFLAAHIKICCEPEKLSLKTFILGHGRLQIGKISLILNEERIGFGTITVCPDLDIAIPRCKSRQHTADHKTKQNGVRFLHTKCIKIKKLHTYVTNPNELRCALAVNKVETTTFIFDTMQKYL